MSECYCCGGKDGENAAKQDSYIGPLAYQDFLNLSRKYQQALDVIFAWQLFLSGNSSMVRPERMTREFLENL